nr:putative transposase [uncultured archaeon]
MAVSMMMSRGLSLGKALKYAGSSSGNYYYKPGMKASKLDDPSVLEHVRELALQRPLYGSRRIAAMLSRRPGRRINRKQVQHVFRLVGWTGPQTTRKELIRSTRKRPPRPTDINQQWQTDITCVWCEVDGWCYLFSILDCYTREWLAYTFSTQCGTDEAIRTLEMAVLERFPDGAVPEGLVTRSDGGSQYTSDRFISTLKVYGIKQEITGKNRPDQNAYIGAFHRSLKEDCIWQHDFQTFHEADAVIGQFFYEYNWDRPHSSLKYMTPKEFYAACGGTG